MWIGTHRSVHNCRSGPYISRAFCTLELIQQVGGFTVCKGGDGIGQVVVRTGARLCGNVYGLVLYQVRLQERDPFKGMFVEAVVDVDLMEVGWCGFFRKLCVVGSEERI